MFFKKEAQDCFELLIGLEWLAQHHTILTGKRSEV
jgi:hypothetical protein